MSNFIEQRRQQFLTEQYFLETKEYNAEGIPLYLESDAFEDDEFNCGEAKRWSGIRDAFYALLNLIYTSGQPIDELIPLFEQVLDSYEKESIALAIFNKSEKPSVIATQNETLNILSLAFLLDRNDLISRIHVLVNGEGDSHTGEDEIINKFFKLNDAKHPTFNQGNLFALGYAKLCDVLDNVLIKQDKKGAIDLLSEYLADWYEMNKNETWYNSHLDLENSVAYVGYWAFEAAALVYLLDLDDSSIQKYLFYPKDIVAWAREKKKQKDNQSILSIDRQQILAGQKVPKSGYWFTVAKENSRQYFKEDDVFPNFESDWGDVYWYFDGEK